MSCPNQSNSEARRGQAQAPPHRFARIARAVLPNRWFWLGVFASLLSCAVFLLPTGKCTNADWHGQIRLLGYLGEYLKTHGTLPLTQSTPVVGLPRPIFYGYSLYSLLAFIVALFHGMDPNLPVKVLAFGTFLLQYCLTAITVRRLLGNRWIAVVTASLVTWTVYPLSNLYARGAINEFFTTALLVCAFCVLALIFAVRDRPGKASQVFVFFFFWTLLAGSHLITGLLGTLFLAAVLPVLAISLINRHSRAFFQKYSTYGAVAAGILLSFCLLGPFLYATLKFYKEFEKGFTSDTLFYMPGWTDGWLERLCPFGVVSNFLKYKKWYHLTPYMEGTINVPLLLLFLGLFPILWRDFPQRKFRAALLGQLLFIGLIFLVLLTLSVSPDLGLKYIPMRLRIMQFPYRMVTYINLILLVGVFLFGGLCLKFGYRLKPSPRLTALLAGVLALSFAVMLYKHVHDIKCLTIPNPYHGKAAPEVVQRDLLDFLPYNTYDYSTPNLFNPVKPPPKALISRLTFTPGLDEKFGDCPELKFTITSPHDIVTNAQAFIWNKIFINGSPLDPSRIHVIGFTQNFQLDPGTYSVSLRTIPDAPYAVLRKISLATLLLWSILTLAAYSLYMPASRRRLAKWGNQRNLYLLCAAFTLLMFFFRTIALSRMPYYVTGILAFEAPAMVAAWMIWRRKWDNALFYRFIGIMVMINLLCYLTA